VNDATAATRAAAAPTAPTTGSAPVVPPNTGPLGSGQVPPGAVTTGGKMTVGTVTATPTPTFVCDTGPSFPALPMRMETFRLTG
jgi:hypothetical protein